MKDIRQLVRKFRDAIDIAKDGGEFKKDPSFWEFPRGCCGDTSDLLAQFLLENDIRTYYVCGKYIENNKDYSEHAWLLTDNNIIIDITGDQFKDELNFLNYDEAVYVGAMDDFHRLFKVEDSDKEENKGLDSLESLRQPSLNDVYSVIIKYI